MTALTFVNALGPVALRYGLDEAIFLHTIVFWARENRSNGSNYRDGRWWTYNSIQGMTEIFPWWSAKQIRRIANSCKEQGAILIANYNSDGRDRTIWYSPSDDLWALYGETETGKSILPNGQMHSPEGADTFAQMGEPLPCNNHVNNNTPLNPPKREGNAKSIPKWKSERFEAFWEYYSHHCHKADRAGAVRAWDKLKPSDELITQIGRSLQNMLRFDDEWSRGIGIPHASRYLRDHRWEDQPTTKRLQTNDPPSSGGMVEDRGLEVW